MVVIKAVRQKEYFPIEQGCYRSKFLKLLELIPINRNGIPLCLLNPFVDGFPILLSIHLGRCKDRLLQYSALSVGDYQFHCIFIKHLEQVSRQSKRLSQVIVLSPPAIFICIPWIVSKKLINRAMLVHLIILKF